jgi:hypothetical protein
LTFEYSVYMLVKTEHPYSVAQPAVLNPETKSEISSQVQVQNQCSITSRSTRAHCRRRGKQKTPEEPTRKVIGPWHNAEWWVSSGPSPPPPLCLQQLPQPTPSLPPPPPQPRSSGFLCLPPSSRLPPPPRPPGTLPTPCPRWPPPQRPRPISRRSIRFGRSLASPPVIC